MSDDQRAILTALTDGRLVLRWRCNDGAHRWHLGEAEVDGRSVRGLWLRGLVEIEMLHQRHPSLVLTDAGRRALAEHQAPEAEAGGGGVMEQRCRLVPTCPVRVTHTHTLVPAPPWYGEAIIRSTAMRGSR